MSRPTLEPSDKARLASLEEQVRNLSRERTPRRFAMRDLTDAQLVPVANGQVPTYDYGSGLWKPGTPIVREPATTVVSEVAFGQSAVVGTDLLFARQGHSHGTPPDPIPPHVGAGDPHAQYITGVTATAPLVSTGGRAPAISATTGQVAGTLAVGDDNRFPTADQRAAMVPVQGTAPTAANPFVVADDPRMSDARTPTAHSHGTSAVTSVNGRTGDVVGLAEDNTVVHRTGALAETIDGPKTFTAIATVGEPSGAYSRLNPFGYIELRRTALAPVWVVEAAAVGAAEAYVVRRQSGTPAVSFAVKAESAFWSIGPALTGKRVSAGVTGSGAITDAAELNFFHADGGTSAGIRVQETTSSKTVSLDTGFSSLGTPAGVQLQMRSEVGLFVAQPGITYRSIPTVIGNNSISPETNRMLVQAGNTVITTSTVGTATIALPEAFPTGCLQVICTNGDWNTQPGATFATGNMTTTNFGVRVRVNNADLASTAVRVHWVAIGY